MKQAGGLFDSILEGKQPWELTLEEYMALSDPPIDRGYRKLRMPRKLRLQRSHESYVLNALVERKDVPPKVRKQYPQLVDQSRRWIRILYELGRRGAAEESWWQSWRTHGERRKRRC